MPTEHSHLLNFRACRKAAVKNKKEAKAKAKAKAAKKKKAESIARLEEQVRLQLARPPRVYVSSRDDDFTGSIPSFEFPPTTSVQQPPRAKEEGKGGEQVHDPLFFLHIPDRVSALDQSQRSG